MLAREIFRHALSRGGSIRASTSRRAIISPLPSRKLAAPATISPLGQARGIETKSYTPSSAHQILVDQRKRRPVSPHLSIYRYQINYFTSPTHRVTGLLLSVPFYLFGVSYLIAPALGWHLDSASFAAAFGSLSPGVKGALKFAMAWPLCFHGINGVAHLIWDRGRRFSPKAIVRQGWTVVGLSLAGAGYLAWFL